MKIFIAAALTAGGLMVPASSFAAEKTVELAVKNLFCASCPYIVKQSLTAVDGVSNARVSYREKTATVTFDDSRTSISALTDATTEAGFPSTLIAEE